MSEDRNQSGTELFEASDETESSSDAASTTKDGEQVATAEGEESEEHKVKLNDEQRVKQISTWLARVQSGEKSLSDIPHEWLRKEIAAKIKSGGSENFDDAFERKYQQREDQKHFDALKDTLTDAKLSASQKKMLQAEFNELSNSGLSKGKALEKAIRLAGIKLDQESERSIPTILRAPRGNGEKSKQEIDPNKFPAHMPVADRLKMYEKIRTGKAA